jgi:hypothetical protein
VSCLGINGWFAWAFVRWWAARSEVPLPSTRLSLMLLVSAFGGMSYLWAPLTPGYYDLTGDLCLALVALLLLALTQSRVSAWNPALAGFLGIVLIVEKWTACLVLLALGVAVSAGLARHGRRVVVRYAVLAGVGAALALVIMQLFVMDLARFTSVMREVSRLTSIANHSATYLARANLSSSVTVLVGGLVLGLLLLIALGVAVRLSRSGRMRAAEGWLVAAGVVSTIGLPFALGWRGGDDHGRVLVGVAFGGLLMAMVAVVLARPHLVPASGEARLVALVLLLVPALQAAGTNVPFPYVAGECLAMWVALVLMLSGDSERFPAATSAVLVDLAVAAAAIAMIAGTTTLMTPFKTSGFFEADVRLPAVGVRVSPQTASRYAALSKALHPYVVRGRTPMISVDEQAGLVYLLGGVPAGSTWTDAASPSRTAGILALACREGDVRHAPVLLLTRRVDRELAATLGDCGYPYPSSYRRLPLAGGPPRLTVMVPRGGF